jgi:uncharacterized lipoprotein YddW (UPF0748 family)
MATKSLPKPLSTFSRERLNILKNRRRSRWASVALALTTMMMTLGCMMVSSAIPSMIPTSHPELRGVWLTNIDSDILFSRDRLKKGIHRLKALNFNTLYPTVWNWGYTLYPSSIARQTIGTSQRLYPDLGHTGQPDARESEQRDRDMLQELITLAHAQHLSVIPWFEFGFMAPANSALAKRHPNWLTQSQDGNPIVMEGADPRVWLNPFHPEVQQFIIDLITEVVTRYDVDGLQLDDHFGLPVALGYDSFTVQRYRQEHLGKKPPSDPHDPDWKRWRADQITEIMAQIFRAVKAKKRNAVISLSPNPAAFAYDTFLQDWVTWEQRGYIEELVVQVYRSDRNRFLMELNRPEIQQARQHIPVSIGILSGLKGRDVPIDWIDQQVKWVRDHHFAGVSFFFYETLWASKTESLRDRMNRIQQLFPHTAQRPKRIEHSR